MNDVLTRKEIRILTRWFVDRATALEIAAEEGIARTRVYHVIEWGVLKLRWAGLGGRLS